MSGKGVDFRPISDTWLLAPGKVGYYGAYPNGFLQRARCLLCRMDEPLLHVCSGKVKDYPGYGFGPNDKTLDINPAMEPDFLQDARKDWPLHNDYFSWVAILTDPPYTVPDAHQYQQYVKNAPPGAPPWDQLKMADVLPSPGELLKNAWQVLAPGGKVGILHYLHPKAPARDARLVAVIQVVQGTNSRPRVFTVFEKEWKA